MRRSNGGARAVQLQRRGRWKGNVRLPAPPEGSNAVRCATKGNSVGRTKTKDVGCQADAVLTERHPVHELLEALKDLGLAIKVSPATVPHFFDVLTRKALSLRSFLSLPSPAPPKARACGFIKARDAVTDPLRLAENQLPQRWAVRGREHLPLTCLDLDAAATLSDTGFRTPPPPVSSSDVVRAVAGHRTRAIRQPAILKTSVRLRNGLAPNMNRSAYVSRPEFIAPNSFASTPVSPSAEAAVVRAAEFGLEARDDSFPACGVSGGDSAFNTGGYPAAHAPHPKLLAADSFSSDNSTSNTRSRTVRCVYLAESLAASPVLRREEDNFVCDAGSFFALDNYDTEFPRNNIVVAANALRYGDTDCCHAPFPVLNTTRQGDTTVYLEDKANGCKPVRVMQWEAQCEAGDVAERLHSAVHASRKSPHARTCGLSADAANSAGHREETSVAVPPQANAHEGLLTDYCELPVASPAMRELESVEVTYRERVTATEQRARSNLFQLLHDARPRPISSFWKRLAAGPPLTGAVDKVGLTCPARDGDILVATPETAPVLAIEIRGTVPTHTTMSRAQRRVEVAGVTLHGGDAAGCVLSRILFAKGTLQEAAFDFSRWVSLPLADCMVHNSCRVTAKGTKISFPRPLALNLEGDPVCLVFVSSSDCGFGFTLGKATAFPAVQIAVSVYPSFCRPEPSSLQSALRSLIIHEDAEPAGFCGTVHLHTSSRG
ncbi:hypothetical protein DIPPA_32826 [Diplonema papillatum]|nr:hypothetical protein DIPPA_32826 [Diplonema papillatum]